MLDRDLTRLGAALTRGEASAADILELCRLSTRIGSPPEGLGEEHLGAVVAAWEEDPEERSPLSIFLPLAGLELPPDGETMPPPWWEGRSRLARDGAQYFDRKSGLPLEVLRRRDGARMVLVPAGPFIQGDPEDDRSSPAHRVHLDSYYADRTLVSVACYGRFLEGTRHPAPLGWELQREDPEGAVTQVTWEDARAYGRWAGARLPTESEHEKAMRGTDGRRFTWGDREPHLQRALMLSETGFARLNELFRSSGAPGAEVLQEIVEGHANRREVERVLGSLFEDTRVPSPFGITDVQNHALSWCLDLFSKGYYGVSPDANPHGPTPGPGDTQRVVRQGSPVHALETVIPCSRRRPWSQDARSPQVGFRLVRSAHLPSQELPPEGDGKATQVRRKKKGSRAGPLQDFVELLERL